MPITFESIQRGIKIVAILSDEKKIVFWYIHSFDLKWNVTDIPNEFKNEYSIIVDFMEIKTGMFHEENVILLKIKGVKHWSLQIIRRILLMNLRHQSVLIFHFSSNDVAFSWNKLKAISSVGYEIECKSCMVQRKRGKSN